MPGSILFVMWVWDRNRFQKCNQMQQWLMLQVRGFVRQTTGLCMGVCGDDALCMRWVGGDGRYVAIISRRRLVCTTSS